MIEGLASVLAFESLYCGSAFQTGLIGSSRTKSSRIVEGENLARFVYTGNLVDWISGIWIRSCGVCFIGRSTFGNYRVDYQWGFPFMIQM